MRMKWTAAAVRGAAALTVFVGTAGAQVADFESKTPFYCQYTSATDGGLNFAYGFAACFYGPTNPADFPTPLSSNVMAIGYSNITVTTVSGSPFNLGSVDLAFGPFSHAGLVNDVTRVTGTQVGGGSMFVDLVVGRGFQTYNLNWNDLSSVTFSQLQTSGEYLAFDNVVYSATVTPEPATVLLLGTGLLGVGAVVRRRSWESRGGSR